MICCACCFIFGGKNFYYIIFAATVHELAHFLCAWLLGYKPECFVFHGFGIELGGVRGRFSPGEIICVAISGPVASMLLAAIGYAICNYELFIINISVAFLNFLPAYPLDGGQVLYGFCMSRMDRRLAKKLVNAIGKTAALLITATGICVLMVTKFNFSLLYIGLFVFFSSRGQIYNPVMEIATKHKKMQRCRLYELDGETDIKKAADSLPCNSVGTVCDSMGKIMGAVTPYQLYMTEKSGSLNDYLKAKAKE